MEKSKLKLLGITLAAVFFMLNFTFLGSSAASNTSTYEIPELAMTMDIPTSIKVITPGIRQSDPIFSSEMFDYIQTMSKFRDNDDYFYGKNSKGSIEFEVTLTENEDGIVNLTKLSEKKQNKVRESVSQQSDVIGSSIYKTDTVVYIESSRSVNNSDGRFFSEEYYTIYDGYNITVKLTSSNDNLSNSESDMLKSIVESVRFPKEKKVNLAEVLSVSEFLCFFLITVSFVILVISKIQSIKREKYRAERQQNRMKQRMERDAREKKEAEQEAAAAELKKNEHAEESSKSESTVEDEKSANENNSKQSEQQEEQTITESVNSTDNINSEKISENTVKQEFSIDLNAAIANFTDSSEDRQERRNSNKKEKKIKLPFGGK